MYQIKFDYKILKYTQMTNNDLTVQRPIMKTNVTYEL